MQITFVSNYINHHQLPLSLELSRLTEGNYTFLQTEPMTEERKNMGWDDSLSKLSFVERYYENPEAGKKLIMDSDVVIFGGAENQSLILDRIKAGKFTIRYSERLYKEGRYKFVSPRGLLEKYKNHIKYRKYPVYLLCAGAYTAGDFNLIKAYPDKMLEFGYFPEFIEYENLHEERKADECPKILWVSRYIDWKHPYLPVKIAKRLLDQGKNFELTMIGCGPMLSEVKNYANSQGLLEKITFIEKESPQNVRKLMRQSDIFMLTSDKGEGWGAVINEAMNAGCAVIASHETGAGPTLIKSGVNGFLFEANNEESLFGQVDKLISDRELSRKLGCEAYKTIATTWNAKTASERLMDFIKDPEHTIKDYEDKGPLSKARILSFAKVKREIGK